VTIELIKQIQTLIVDTRVYEQYIHMGKTTEMGWVGVEVVVLVMLLLFYKLLLQKFQTSKDKDDLKDLLVLTHVVCFAGCVFLGVGFVCCVVTLYQWYVDPAAMVLESLLKHR
jgi:integral membrane sensor domain MASE1